MKRIKILMMQDFSDDEYSRSIVRDSISDWEEVDDEEFKFLKNNFHRMFNLRHDFGYEFKPILIVEDDVPPSHRIQDIKKLIKDEQARIAKEKKDREKKKLEREMKKKAKTVEQQRVLYEELEKKFGPTK